jgi:hypothetical protein
MWKNSERFHGYGSLGLNTLVAGLLALVRKLLQDIYTKLFINFKRKAVLNWAVDLRFRRYAFRSNQQVLKPTVSFNTAKRNKHN